MNLTFLKKKFQFLKQWKTILKIPQIFFEYRITVEPLNSKLDKSLWNFSAIYSMTEIMFCKYVHIKDTQIRF